jgi:acetyltransferase-like isoleucine patch superfamily enzyme
LGAACKLHLNVTVHHEVEIGDFCTIGPGAQLLGKVSIGENSYVGAGAIIRQRCVIGRNVKIGAGAVVVSDIPDNITVVGVPANRTL